MAKQSITQQNQTQYAQDLLQHADNLVSCWIDVEQKHRGNTLAQALEALNQHLDSSHTHSRIREWEAYRCTRGNRLPRPLREYMASIAAPIILQAAGINTDEINQSSIDLLAKRFC